METNVQEFIYKMLPMKKIILIFSALLFQMITTEVFATRQDADLLIIGTDTLYLYETFPLENLKLKIRPFGHIEKPRPGSSCWRGYRAIWRIIDNKLYLEKIIRCRSDRNTGEQNIKELFDSNEIDYVENNEMIFADWVTQEWLKISLPELIYYKDKITLIEWSSENKKRKQKIFKIKIENGIITENNIFD